MDDLNSLRRKVQLLESMIHVVNDKIGLVLEEFLAHRASKLQKHVFILYFLMHFI